MALPHFTLNTRINKLYTSNVQEGLQVEKHLIQYERWEYGDDKNNDLDM